MSKYIKTTIALLLVSIMLSCATTSVQYEEGQPSKVYFRKAQEAEVNKNISLALKIYDVIIQNFTQEPVSIFKAWYEKGRLAYRSGNTGLAKTCFENVMAMYNEDPTLPEGIIILTKKFLE